ncbi:MAG: diguanylate cyclase [Gammaproteobacteria bacterium]|nr:diguanylate cyclase [Gammaproteobacteria bacterium]
MHAKNLHEVSIGVLAHRGAEKANLMWMPTAKYLESKIKGYQFKLIPLSLPEMEQSVKNNELDFILTNTGNYVNLEFPYGITRVATLKNMRQGKPYTSFGAVIIVRSDNEQINSLSDLEGKSFAAVSKNAFGGFQMAWRELKQAGINPFEDFSSIKFMGFPQDDIVKSVRDGIVDAGTVRTDTLERMIKSGEINSNDFRILNQKKHTDFPFFHSTALYPEWPFARARNTDDDFATQVVIALLSLSPNDPVSKAGLNAGWTVPLSYQSVHDIFKELKVGPYAKNGKVTLTQIIKQYRYWLMIIILGLIFAAYHFIRVERLVVKRTKELERAYKEQQKYLDVFDTNVISSSTDAYGNITEASKAFCQISQYSLEDLIGKSHNIIRHPDMPVSLYEKMWKELQSGKSWNGEVKNKAKDGSAYWVEAHIEPQFDEAGNIFGYTAIRKDITNRKRIEELSVTDTLTKLYNRLRLDQKLTEEFYHTRRYHHPLSIIMLDVDHFKEVNDTYGHQVGDFVLIGIADLIRKGIRKTDFVGRWGGEEFLIICPETPAQGAKELAETLRKKLEQRTFDQVGQKTCSFGVATLNDEESVELLLSRADKALYTAKESGRNRVVSAEV